MARLQFKGLGLAYERQGRTEDAIFGVSGDANELTPDDANAHFELGGI